MGGEKEIRDLVSPLSLPNKSPWGKKKKKTPPDLNKKEKKRNTYLEEFFSRLEGSRLDRRGVAQFCVWRQRLQLPSKRELRLLSEI